MTAQENQEHPMNTPRNRSAVPAPSDDSAYELLREALALIRANGRNSADWHDAVDEWARKARTALGEHLARAEATDA